ncbi:MULTISPECIES: hypothetical protein [unclassified Listeria]|uniref:hypothetical protein n=1 Tax=unclassified Listeria TaxID=2642072 RepID=UPI000B591947|nr:MULTISPECIES: hypothetical protein [unclassified Listeria]
MDKKKLAKTIVTPCLIAGMIVAGSPAGTALASDNEMIQATGISVYERGSLKIKGTAAKSGISYDAKNNATGVLSLNYYAQYGFGGGVADQTYYTLKLPQEFEEISKTDSFKKAVTAKFRQKATGITMKSYKYMQQDFSIEDNTLIFKNPRFSYIVESRILVDVDIDLGKVINETGMHIPKANETTKYRFMGQNVQNVNLINWNLLFGSDNDAKTTFNVMDSFGL